MPPRCFYSAARVPLWCVHGASMIPQLVAVRCHKGTATVPQRLAAPWRHGRGIDEAPYRDGAVALLWPCLLIFDQGISLCQSPWAKGYDYLAKNNP